MWKRYLYMAVCLFVLTGIATQPGTPAPVNVLTIEEGYSLSLGPALPAVVALAILAYSMLVAKRDNWWVILGCTGYLFLWLANL